MHFRHRETDRQTDTDIVAQARDVYIASRANNSDDNEYLYSPAHADSNK